MTFSAKVKEELCRIPIDNPETALAECCGMVLFANTTKTNKLKIVTENANVALRASRLLKSLFGFDFDRKIVPAASVKKYNLTVETPSRLSEVFEALGLDTENSLSLRLNAAIVESDEARSAFCRGAFLTGGSATDPESEYHLELVTSHFSLSREVISTLLDLELPAKLAFRKSNYIIYFKESGNIEDFLTRIGAPLCAMEIMQAKLYKDLRNKVNRQVNCETANMNKAADAAGIQLRAIKHISQTIGLDSLSPQLQMAATLRIENPDKSLSELAELVRGQVGRSGLNHRLNKLISISEEISARKDTTEE